MHRRICALLATLVAVTANGCLTQQITNDSKNFRAALEQLYVDQAIDNLILARNNQPFIHIAYSNLIVTDTLNAKVSAGNEYDPNNSQSILGATGAFLQHSNAYVNHALFGANAENDRQLQIQSDPVVGKDQIYEYYRAFANDPDLFCCSETEPEIECIQAVG